jgi:hypothetical protein
MAIRNSNNNITGYGVGAANIELAPVPESWNRAPTTADIGFKIGYQAIYDGSVYSYTGAAAGLAVWVILGGGSSDVNTINSLAPTAGNINITGTTNRVTVSSTGSTVNVTLPNTVSGLTGVSANTLTAASGNITATNGNLVLSTAGNKLQIAAGANCSVGTATLVNGTVTVANTAVTASSIIFFTRDGLNASTAIADIHVTAVGANTFTATSTRHNTLATETNDQSTFNYLIIN